MGSSGEGVECGEGVKASLPTGDGPGRGSGLSLEDVFWNFQLKNAGCYAFLLQETSCDQKLGHLGGGLNRLGLKM